MNIRAIVTTYCPQLLLPIFDRIIRSPIASRLSRGVFWTLCGTVISRGLMLCAMILVARLLGKVAYGELGIIRSTIGMLGVFAGFGMGVTATKHVAELRYRDPERTGHIIALSGIFAMLTGGLMAVVLFLLAPWLAEHTINAPHLDSTLQISALFLLLNALNGAQTGALSGFEAFKTIAKVNLFVGLISFPILMISTYVGGLTGTVWGLTINLGFHWLLNHFALRRELRRHNIPLQYMTCGCELPVIWQYSLPAAMAGAMVGPINWACYAMLVNLPSGYSEMGLFSAADQWYALLIFLPTVIGNVALPLLADQLGGVEKEHSIKTMILTIKVNLIIVAPLILITCGISPWIMSLYGESFRDGWPTLVVALLTAGLLAALIPIAQVITASGKMWVLFYMNAGWGMIFLIFSKCFIEYGSFGLASARAVAYIAHVTWMFAFAYRVIFKRMSENE